MTTGIKERKATILKKRRIVCAITLVILILTGILYAYAKQGKREFKSYENVLERNLEYKMISIPEEPKTRKVAWDSELPNFVQKDMEQLKKNELLDSIKYEFKDFEISIYFREFSNDFKIYVKEPENVESFYNIDYWENFSIYKNKDNIVICGYSGNCFFRMEIGDKTNNVDILAQTKDVPINTSGLVLSREDEYTILLRDDGKRVCVYQRGELLIQSEDEIGTIKDVVYLNNMFINDENQLFSIYVDLNKKELNIEKVDGGIVEDNDFVGLIHVEENTFPVFLVSGEYCCPLPSDWNNIYSSIKMIPLSNLFKSANIYYVNYREDWLADITFELNGKTGSLQACRLNGYDGSVELSEEEKKVEIHVEDIPGFWNAVEQIRQMYQKYYDYPKQ